MIEKVFSAKICLSCYPIDITTMEDAGYHKRVFICGNSICAVGSKCNTVYEEKSEGMQIPLKELIKL